MKELFRTNDAVYLSFAQAVLKGEGIETLLFDGHMSVMDGSIGALPRRLMVVDDVIIPGPQDPVPVTAYRWARADVEQYVTCGIPKPGTQNDCSNIFFRIARTVILKHTNYVPRGR